MEAERERRLSFRGPLADSYAAAVALVVLALIPFLAVTAAIVPLLPTLSHSLGLSGSALTITLGLADAAYAFGTVVAVQLAVHLPGRRLLLGYVSLFVAAAALAAWAPSAGVFAAALVVEGLCTSLMLIGAVPPLVVGWPAAKMPVTATIMNLCIFGAVAAGPSIGSVQAASGGWRPLFWTVAGIGAAALVFAVLTYEDQPPQDRSAPWDLVAVVLAGAGCAAAFFGAARLEADGAPSVVSLTPLVAGAAMVVALVVHQYRMPSPLMPVRQLATTLPVAAIVLAMSASAAAVGLTELALTAIEPAVGPAHTALLFLPEVGAAAATAALFGALFRTRFTPLLALSGIAVLSGAALLLTRLHGGGDVVAALGTAMIGFGVGATVSPALFIAGFSLRSAQIQRVFALIELLRGLAAFLVSPILLFLAATIASSAAGGIRAAVWICLAIAGGGGAAAMLILPGRAAAAAGARRRALAGRRAGLGVAAVAGAGARDERRGRAGMSCGRRRDRRRPWAARFAAAREPGRPIA